MRPPPLADEVRALLTNPVRPDLRQDPYPLYARLQEDAPVLRVSGARWLVTRHADAVAVLRSPAFGSDHRKAIDYEQYLRDQGGPNPLQELMMAQVIVFKDPPDHPRLRGLVTKAFSAPTVRLLRERVEALTDVVIDDLWPRGAMDLAEEYAALVPLGIICELLGVPTGDHERMAAWSRDLAAVFDARTSPETLGRAGEAALNFGLYILELVREREQTPQDDLLTALVTAEQQSDRLTPEELVSTAIFLLRAGQETVQHALAASVLTLFTRPALRERFAAGDVDVGRAVDELLRFEAPVQITARTALEDTAVGDCAIPVGHQVLVVVGAANRDPEVFRAPQDVDLDRHPNPHLAFVAGPHFCLGAALARLEMEVALPRLLTRLPGLRLDGVPRWRETSALRGLDHLPVAW